MGRRYRSPLREEQSAATRERILDAAHGLLKHTRPVDLAWSRVAEAASVSERTVYRHFPRPEDLFMALSDRLLGQLGPPPGSGSPTLREAVDSFRRQLEL